MTLDPKLSKIFPAPPMVAFKQPPNLKKLLCRAKLPTDQKQKKNNCRHEKVQQSV
jgi:hypothetical protein